MPEITVTETQRERLETVRSELAAAYIDTYGHIRTEDALEYLLDTYTPPSEQSADVAYERIATAEFPELQRVAADVESVPGSGIDTETMRGELLSALGVEEFAARLADIDTPEEGEDGDDSAPADDETAQDSDAGAVSDAPDEAGEESEAADESVDASDESEGASEDADDSDAASDGSDEPTSTTGGPGSGGDSSAVLSAANRLLDEHDDKWREGSDEPYEVDLPDGTTEKVRTKDDIRGLLFKHY